MVTTVTFEHRVVVSREVEKWWLLQGRARVVVLQHGSPKVREVTRPGLAVGPGRI